MTFATLAAALECLDDWAADHPLEILRLGYAEHLSAYRLDACATAEPAAALVHAYDLLTPERRAWCLERAAGDHLQTFVPDRLEPERRQVLGIGRGEERDGPAGIGPAHLEK